jgi:hypothetical protein
MKALVFRHSLAREAAPAIGGRLGRGGAGAEELAAHRCRQGAARDEGQGSGWSGRDTTGPFR